jgi:hypothetical protein
VPLPLTTLFFTLYFLVQAIGSEKVVVHLRKQRSRPIQLARKILRNKFSYVVEIEGDPVSEAEYLRDHPYNENHYQQLSCEFSEIDAELAKQVKSADGVLVVTDELKDLFISRYGNKSDLWTKFCVLPTGFDAQKFFFDESLRNKKRKELNSSNRFLVIFIGNVFYSWQNIKSTIDVFERLKNKSIRKNPFLILLVKEDDHPIAKEFLKKSNLTSDDFLLSAVPHDEINSYLNASDMGILLRDNHVMNKVASPGKMGEYLAAGIDVLTTPYIGTYSAPMVENEIGIIVDDFRDLNSVELKLRNKLGKKDRKEVSDWARESFSSQRYTKRYIEFLERI